MTPPPGEPAMTPMSEEELQEIEARASDRRLGLMNRPTMEDIPRLIAEVRRLRDAVAYVGEPLRPAHQHRFFTDDDGAVHGCVCGEPWRPNANR